MSSGVTDNNTLFGGSPLCLAPMAGYSDAPFRRLCFEYGADIAITEMVSADGLVRNGEKTHRIMQRMEGEGKLGVQLFGSDPVTMAGAAAKAAGTSPSFIDLNFGCPVKKVIRKNGGAALMRDLPLIGRICRDVVRSVDIPVTAKIRSGWNRAGENYLEAGMILQDEGIAAVTLHPRFRSDGFSGKADWDHIRRLKEALSIPVIASGDVKSVDDYLKVVEETGCDAVMIGRGAFGRPWIFREIKDTLAGLEVRTAGERERIDILERLVRMEVEWKGEGLGIIEMRKHYRWFLKCIAGAKDFRCRLSISPDLDDVLGIISDLREETDRRWKRDE